MNQQTDIKSKTAIVCDVSWYQYTILFAKWFSYVFWF